jgi:molybdopterin converting factor subunit 1
MTVEPAITIEVLLFASARESAGTDRVRLTLPAATTAGQALAAVIALHPGLAGHEASLRLAVNSEYVTAGHRLAPGDLVALIPPTCGG